MRTSVLTVFVWLSVHSGFSQNIDQGLILHYPASGTYEDASGNNFTASGNATFASNVNGAANQSFSFNGLNQYLDFPNDPSLKPQLPVSFAFWLYLESTDPTDAVFFVTDFGFYQHSGAWMNISSNGLISISYGSAAGGLNSAQRRTKQGNSLLEVGQWYYIVGVIRGPTDMSIYINCEDDGGAYNGTGEDIGYTDTPGTIGRKYGHNLNPAYYFHGRIANFRYYDRELHIDDVDRLCEVETSFTVGLENSDGVVKLGDNCLVSVYPNPASDYIRIEGDSIHDSMIRFYNLQGQIVKETASQSRVDVSDLVSGSYLVQLVGASCSYQRLVICR